MIGALNTVSLAAAGTLDNEVREWYTNVLNLGGNVSQNTLEAVNNFMLALKGADIRNKIRRCNLFCGINLPSALYPIITSSKEGGEIIGNKTDVNRGFVSADYWEDSGLYATNTSLNVAATKYLETDVFLPSAGITAKGGHLSFMSTPGSVDVIAAKGYMMPLCGGDYSTAFDLTSHIEFDNGEVKAASPSSFDAAMSGGKGHVETTGANDIGGFYVASRTSSSNQILWRNSVQVGQVATGELCPNDINGNPDCYPTGGYKFRIFGTFRNNIVTQTNTYRLMFYSMGEGLSLAESNVIYLALTEFNTAINRS